MGRAAGATVSGSVLHDAEPIGPKHTGWLQNAFSSASKSSWCYYAPFLCCFSLPPRRRVFVSEKHGALWVLVRRYLADAPQVDLVVPPLPFSNEALDSFLDEMAGVDPRPARILWVDQEDADRLPVGRFDLRLKDTEYVYDPARVAAASGGEYRDLRKRLNRFKAQGSVRFRRMEGGDVPECLAYWKAGVVGRGGAAPS